MSASPPTNATVKQEELDPDTGLCLICTLPIRVPGGESDALQCGQCGVVYHRECAPDWTSECPQCLGKEVVFKWTRSLPPGPGVEVVELDGDVDDEEVEEEEEDEAAAKRRKKTAYERERIARQPAQRCGVDGCEFQTKHKKSLKRHQARVHGFGDVGAGELKSKRRAKPMRSSRARPAVNYAGGNSDDSDATDSSFHI
jgi:hypothetical protein